MKLKYLILKCQDLRKKKIKGKEKKIRYKIFNDLRKLHPLKHCLLLSNVPFSKAKTRNTFFDNKNWSHYSLN